MAAIGNLNRVSVVTLADLVPIFSAAAGSDAACSVATLFALLQSLQPDAREVPQYASPGGSGFAAQVMNADDGVDVFYLLTPLAGYAAGSVILPNAPWDGQRVNVHCSQSVTTFSVTGALNIHGAPTTLAAAAFFTLRWDAATTAWWRSA